MALTLKAFSDRGFEPHSLGLALETVFVGPRKPTKARSSNK
jgi:hypothetical protein